MLLEEELEGAQLLERPLDVVEALDGEDALFSVELLPEPRGDPLDLLGVEDAADLVEVDADRVRAEVDGAFPPARAGLWSSCRCPWRTRRS